MVKYRCTPEELDTSKLSHPRASSVAVRRKERHNNRSNDNRVSSSSCPVDQSKLTRVEIINSATMRLIVDLCCNPLGLEYGNHDINVEPVSESLRELFWGYLHGETHTCLLCRLKLLQELWLSDPDRCDPPIIGIVREAEETINRMESDLVRMNKSADDEDSPLR